MSQTDREEITRLLGRLAMGERAAISPAFQRLWPVVRAFCQTYLKHADGGEDAAQNAIIKIFERVNTYDARRDGLTWVLTIAVWECRTLRRRLGRQPRTSSVSSKTERVDPRQSPEEEVSLKQSLESLSPLIDRLSEEHRAALRDALDGARGDDVTRRKRKQRAIEQLRRWWEMFHGRA
jgi:RNA polymerase sigma factor (sigma-70 family)